MELTEKDNAILCVLKKRAAECENAIKTQKAEIEERQKFIDYLSAKKEGYDQAIDLLKEPLENIKVEIV